MRPACTCCSSFCFHDSATPEIYTLSLHDALPICMSSLVPSVTVASAWVSPLVNSAEPCTRGSRPTSQVIVRTWSNARSEEHTSELQSHSDLVCRLLLEKKNATSRAMRTAVFKVQA